MEKKKTDLKEILSFLLILAGSAILAINMNTFVEHMDFSRLKDFNFSMTSS